MHDPRRAPAPASLTALLAFLLFLPLPAKAQSLTHPDARDDIFYQFMPIAWRDSNNDAQRFGDFGGMTASLDYLADTLGVTAVWMTPIFPSPAYHGYQHDRADLLNSRFGTEAQFLNFLSTSHSRGVKVFLDIVPYGISHNSIYYQSARNNPASQYDAWLAFTNAANTTYTGYTFPTWNGATVGFIHWNLDNPNPRALNIAWARKWLDPNNDGDPSDGIDGFRIDHVYTNAPEGWGANLAWWQEFCSAVKNTKPSAFNFAEQGDWGNFGADLLPAFDATFTKPFLFAARDALNNETAAGLYSSMAATLASLPGGLSGPNTYLCTIGDHDVNRITSVLGGSLAKARAAAACHILQPFPPVIYFGDEIGMLGTKAQYGSDADDIPMREPFKWLAVAGPPMSNYHVLHTPAYNNRFSRNNDGRSVQEQLGVPGSLLETYRELIALRKANPALRRGDYAPVPASSSRIWAFLRPHETQTLLCAVNVSANQVTTTLNFSGFNVPGGSSTVTDLVSSQNLAQITAANQSAYSLTIPAYSYRVLAVSLAAPQSKVTGRDLPASYPPALASQTNPTSFGDFPFSSSGAELNQLFSRAASDGLYIALSGNIPPDGTALCLFLDSDPATGQNTLNTPIAPPPGGLQQLTGTRFDPGFTPNFAYFINAAGNTVYVDRINLPTAAPGAKLYRGNVPANSGSGLLAGGSNPLGLEVAFDNSNTAGVSASSAADPGSASTGFEIFIPWAELSLPPAISPPDPCARIAAAAILLRTNGTVANQVLPPIAATLAASLGLAPDFSALPGTQYALIPLGPSADFDASGSVNSADVTAFLNTWFGSLATNDLAADFDLSGSVNSADVTAFLNTWFAALAGNC